MSSIWNTAESLILASHSPQDDDDDEETSSQAPNVVNR